MRHSRLSWRSWSFSGRLRESARWPHLVALLLGLLLGGCATLLGAGPLADARPGTTSFHTMRVAGRTRSFLLHLPPAAARHAVPLVLLFHGDGASGNEIMEASGMNEEADRRGFAVAYPNGTGRLRFLFLHWNAVTCCGYATDHEVDDVRFVDTLAAALARLPAVDSTRLFAAGFSAGGMLALRLACERAARYTAVADVAGVMPDTTCVPARPVSVLFFQGQDDDELRFDFRHMLRRGHPFARSLESAARFWARRDGCVAAAKRDSTSGYALQRARCPGRLGVELYTIAGHPHAWPGGERTWFFDPEPAQAVQASRVILSFFQDHPR